MKKVRLGPEANASRLLSAPDTGKTQNPSVLHYKEDTKSKL